MSISKVALAGAGGNIGTPILEELIAAGFEVTVLSRPDSKSTFPSSVRVAKVDYNSEPSLHDALKGQDALISTITTGAVETQFKLVDAAIAAGVKRILPSEFGSDTLNPVNRKLPVFGQKVAIQQHLEEKTKGTQTTYTYFINNVFLDWAIKSAPFLVNAKEKTIELYDGGKTGYSATSLGSIAKGVVGVLKNLDKTANRAVYVSSTVLSQGKIFELAKKVLGADGWTATEPSTAEAEKSAYETLQTDPSNLSWAFGFLKRAIFSEEHKPHFTKTDNDLLGVPQTSDEEVEEWIKEASQA